MANALAGNGTVNVDAGATLILRDGVSAKSTIAYTPPSNAPLSEHARVRSAAWIDATITGFSYADRLVLDGVTTTGASYDSGTAVLAIALQGGTTEISNLTGNLAGLSQFVSGGNTIQFVAPSTVMATAAPAPDIPGTVDKDVLVPGIVLQMPFPNDRITVTLTTSTGGRLSALEVAGTTVTGNGTTLTITGTLFGVERACRPSPTKVVWLGRRATTFRSSPPYLAASHLQLRRSRSPTTPAAPPTPVRMGYLSRQWHLQ